MALALAACSASEAAPGSGGSAALPPGVNPPFAQPTGPIAAVPTGWISLPALALAARTQLPGSTTDAWGEPAMGCYAASLQVGERGPVAALVADVKRAVTVRDVVEPSAAGGVLSFGFDKPPYHGRVRALLDGKNVTALACFWNQREPIACEAACAAMLRSMR